MNANKKRFYNQIEIAIMVTFLAIMVMLTFMNVITRYFMGFTVTWSEQLVRLLFVWVSYAVVSYAGLSGEHIRVTVLCSFLPDKASKILLLIGDLIGVVFAIYTAVQIGGVFLVGVQSGQSFASIPWLPVYTMYLPGVLGMAGFAVRTIQRNVIQYALKTGKGDEEK